MKVNVTSVDCGGFCSMEFRLVAEGGDNKTVQFERVSHVFHFHKFSLQCAGLVAVHPEYTS